MSRQTDRQTDRQIYVTQTLPGVSEISVAWECDILLILRSHAAICIALWPALAADAGFPSADIRGAGVSCNHDHADSCIQLACPCQELCSATSTKQSQGRKLGGKHHELSLQTSFLGSCSDVSGAGPLCGPCPLTSQKLLGLWSMVFLMSPFSCC